MAGSPQKRARREAEQRGNVGIPLGPRAGAHTGAPNAPTGDARSHVAPAPARTRGVAPGPGVRRAADEHATEQVQHFADGLHPGAVVRIERLRPTWCAGWVDDCDLDAAGYAELMRYIHDQWGGQHYKLSVMGTNDAVLMETRQAIAGPPRKDGRLIDRDAYERAINGEPLRQPEPAPVAQAPDGVQTAIALIDALRGDGNGAQMAKLEAKIEQLTEKLNAAPGTAPAETGSLKSQLGELASGLSALEEIKTTIADTIPGPAAGVDEADTPLGAIASRVGADVVARYLGVDGAKPDPNAPAAVGPSPSNGHGAPPPGIPRAR